MKLLYIISSTSPFGGSSLAFMRLALNLKSKWNIDMLVACPTKNGIYYDLIRLGISVKVIPHRYHTYPPHQRVRDLFLFFPKLLLHFIINMIACFRLFVLAIHYHPNIIHSNVGVINIGYLVAKLLNIPHIYHLREYQDLDFHMTIIPSLDNYKSKLKSKGNYCICITKGIQSYFDLNQDNSVVIYDGVKEVSAISFDEKKKPYFLFVGRLQESKGIEVIIKTFADYLAMGKKQDYELWIAGFPISTAYELKLKKLVKILGIEDHVRFLGVRNDTGTLMKCATALIIASNFEAFGLVTAEAMFNGCLVIGKDIAGTKEQFDNGLQYQGEEIALRFENSDELRDLLVDITDGGIEPYYPMILRGQKTVQELYSIETNVKQVYEYYLKILNFHNE